MTRLLPRAVLLSLVLSACASELADEAELGGEDDARADSTGELRVRAADTSLWVRTHLTREARDGRDTLVLRGRTSRNIEDGNGFVDDDPYGTFASIGPRSFELTWGISESRTLLTGVDQFIALNFASSAPRVAARVVVRPRLTGYTGTGLSLVYSVQAVVSGGHVVYRVSGHANGPIQSLDADAAGVAVANVRIDGSEFEIDLSEAQLLALMSTSQSLTVRATLVSGVHVQRGASVILAVSKLGLTAGDAYETWPRPTCTNAMRACIASVPAGSTDLGACGDAIEVLACPRPNEVTVDSVAVQTAVTALDGRVAALHDDATALVGAARADAWLTGAHRLAQESLQAQLGNVYSDAATRDAALTAAGEAGIDLAYARPLDLVPAIIPIIGDAARERDVAADALLTYVAQQDWLHTELQRPLIELTHIAREQHVASLRAFRETIAPVDGLAPNSDAYIGDWIALYTEVELDRATEVPNRILVEID